MYSTYIGCRSPSFLCLEVSLTQVTDSLRVWAQQALALIQAANECMHLYGCRGWKHKSVSGAPCTSHVCKHFHTNTHTHTLAHSHTQMPLDKACHVSRMVNTQRAM